MQRYLAEFFGPSRKPYRGERYVPQISIVSAAPAHGTAALSNSAIHRKFNTPCGDCVPNNVRFLENKLRGREKELRFSEGQPRLISGLLSEWTGGHPFFAKRERILATIMDETVEQIWKQLASEAVASGKRPVMTKDALGQKIEGIFVRNQIEFLARVLAYRKHTDALTMHRRAHFETAPLCADGFLGTRYQDTIKKAQTKLFGRLVAAGVENITERKPKEIPSATLQEWVCQYFREEAISAMRKFVAENPGYSKFYALSPKQVFERFETRFRRGLDRLGGRSDYVNDGMAAALESALYRSDNTRPSEKLIFQKLDRKVNPAVLLTQASERAGEKMLRRELHRMRRPHREAQRVQKAVQASRFA